MARKKRPLWKRKGYRSEHQYRNFKARQKGFKNEYDRRKRGEIAARAGVQRPTAGPMAFGPRGTTTERTINYDIRSGDLTAISRWLRLTARGRAVSIQYFIAEYQPGLGSSGSGAVVSNPRGGGDYAGAWFNYMSYDRGDFNVNNFMYVGIPERSIPPATYIEETHGVVIWRAMIKR